MPTPNFTEFDAQLITLIGSGASQFSQMTGPMEPLAKPFVAGTTTEPWRVVDRRLQALRRRGQISYSPGAGWETNNTTEGQA